MPFNPDFSKLQFSITLVLENLKILVNPDFANFNILYPDFGKLKILLTLIFQNFNFLYPGFGKLIILLTLTFQKGSKAVATPC